MNDLYINRLKDRINELEFENEKLRKCVEFYADLGNWEGFYMPTANVVADKCLKELGET